MAEEKFKCNDCGKEFSNKNSMLQHKRDAHDAVIQQQSKKTFNTRKILPYLVIVLVITGIGGIAYWLVTYNQNSVGSINSFDFSFVPYEGNASAKINIIEFGDYQCPVCRAFFSQTEPQVLQNYVDNRKAKFYFMDFAFLGPDSITLAEGAWCANDQNLYYAYHDYIYSNQGIENTGWASPGKVKTFAANIQGIDVQKFSACLDNQTYQSRVQQLYQVATSSSVTGTPTFFIGNSNIGYTSVVGNQPFATFKQTIDSQLAKVS